MIKLENLQIVGLEPAIRGMRNPMNSWDMSDGGICSVVDCKDCALYVDEKCTSRLSDEHEFVVGNNDLKLMKRLANAGSDHAKFRRMIAVYIDITAPLYWWKEFDTYKVGTVANSCSTMHKIHEKKFTLDDFSHEHFTSRSLGLLMQTIKYLNECRDLFLNYDTNDNKGFPKPTKKEIWWQMIQLLPSSYNQRRTIMLNYEVLANMYSSRKTHKLDEWVTFCEWIKNLPYAKDIIVKWDCKGV